MNRDLESLSLSLNATQTTEATICVRSLQLALVMAAPIFFNLYRFSVVGFGDMHARHECFRSAAPTKLIPILA